MTTSTPAPALSSSRRLHIFRAGTYPQKNGPVTLDETAVAAIANGYDPATHEAPVVVGHPKDNAPAFGWIKSLRAEGKNLYAEVDELDPVFAEAVKRGRYKKISASFYGPSHASNPAPGRWSLRHVGFLGAQPPAVKGLRAVAFAECEGPDLVIETDFADADSGDADVVGPSPMELGLGPLARLLRSLREWLIDEKDLDTANRVLPDWDIDRVADAVTEAQRASRSTVFAESGTDTDPPFPADEQDTLPTQETAMSTQDNQASAAEQAAELAAREQALAAREAALAEQEQRTRHAAAAAFAEAAVTEGRVLPRDQAPLTELLVALADSEQTVAFAETQKDRPKAVPLATFVEGFISRLPTQVEYAELSADDGREAETLPRFEAPGEAAVNKDSLAIHQKVLDYAEQHGTDYDTALVKVSLAA